MADGKVYIGDEDGDVAILKAGTQFELINEINMGSAVYTTPIAKDGMLYIGTRNTLYAIKGNRRGHYNMEVLATSFADKIKDARDTLDAHVRDMVAWHFNPSTGCPFWLEFAAELDFDPRREIGGYSDLKYLGHFQDEWLRGGPVRRWIPRGSEGQRTYVFETGGSTGVPKYRISQTIFRSTTKCSASTFLKKHFQRERTG